MLRRVDGQEHEARGGVVDENEGREIDDCIFKFLHYMVMLLLPDKLHILACKVDERMSNDRIVADSTHIVPAVLRKACTSVTFLQAGQVRILAVLESSWTCPL